MVIPLVPTLRIYYVIPSLYLGLKLLPALARVLMQRDEVLLD